MNRPAVISSLVSAVAAFLAGRYAFMPEAPPAPGRTVAAIAAEKAQSPSVAGAKTGSTAPAAHEAVPAQSASRTATEKELMEILYNLADAGKQRDAAGAVDIIADWLARDPEAALAFIAGSPRRDEILINAMDRWAKRDPAAASGWLAAHNDFPGRDAMAAGLASSVSREDPQAAVKWVASIKDPATKISAAADTGYAMFRQSDAAVEEALAGMGIPDSARITLADAWQKKLRKVSSRQAQNLASVWAAAQAAGTEAKASSIEEVQAALAAGIKGSGNFSTTLFKVDGKDLTPRETAAVAAQLEVSEGNVSYTGGSGR